MLILWPPWSIWADMRTYINISGTDDFIQRIYILLTFVLLIGYTAPTPPHCRWKAPQNQKSRCISSPRTILVQTPRVRSRVLPDRLLRLVVILAYAWLRKSRAAHLVQAVTIFVPVSLLPSALQRAVRQHHCDRLHSRCRARDRRQIPRRAGHPLKARNPKMVFIPAQEIGHAIAKTAAFFMLVCGEILFGTLLDPPLPAVC